MMGLLLATQTQISIAERDFNFNDSQVPLIEPKDEPTVIVFDAAHHHHYHHNNQQIHPHQDPYVVELSQCHYGDSEFVLSLVLKNNNWHDLSDTRKAKVLGKLSQFFAIPKEFITMESVTKHGLYEMQKYSVKRGTNKCHHNNRKLGRVNFIIGCGTKYFSMGEPIAKQIGQQVKDGSLDNITGEKFGWWIIWRKEYKDIKPSRNRRQVEGSGDDDNDDYEEDNYEYDDEEDAVQESATDIPTTTTHAHRHHHGDNSAQDGNIDVKTTPEDAEEYEDSAQSLSSTVQTDFESSSSNPTLSYTSGGSTASTAVSSTIAETTTTTTAVPDYVEPKIENSPPIIKLRLQKLAVTSGKSFKFTIPEDTFYDNEDMNNLRLEITDKDGHELKTNSWLQFNSEAREIYGLPLDDAVSKWQYRLTATDSGNESVTETVEISVQQHRGVRTVNHEINIAVKINEKNIHYIDWQLKLIEAIATTMGDNNTKSIVVREIRQTSQDPHTATLVYFNETVPTNQCPESELNNLVKHLDAQRLSDLVHPILGIKSITGQLTGPCQKIVSIKPKTPSISAKNSPPVPRNQVDRVVATTGHLLVYKVPSDTFFDPNDNELKLNLKTKDNKDLNPRHWLQFDVKNHEFYGIPKGGDIGPEEYLLVAEDSGGLTATDALVVQVNHAPKREFSVYFKIYLAIRHEQFNADLQRKFVERIAQLFGDGSTQNIQIRSVTTHHDADGTIVNFYNTTLFKMHNRCPEEEIEMARNVYLDGHAVRDKVKKLMGPELNVTNVQVSTLGICNPQTDVTHREFIPNRTEEPLLRSTFSDDYMFTIIMPAIIIVVMVLVAAIIACCLHRRRRKSGKMELGDEEERKSFRTKGIPVIFQDELDEKPEIGNKSPIILKDEKPPLLPPSYNTSNMNGDNDVDEYVPPPAVVVGGREARGKSPATPSYRKPPPYVSP